VSEKRTCPECLQEITVTRAGSLRAHRLKGDLHDQYCPGGNQPSGKTSIEDKAARLLTEGKVKVVYVRPGHARALVQGSREAPYVVEFVGEIPSCDCDAQIWRCSHVVAVERILHADVLKGAAEVPALEDLVVEPSEGNPDDVVAVA
jgi:hypothetical protein